LKALQERSGRFFNAAGLRPQKETLPEEFPLSGNAAILRVPDVVEVAISF
jgi:hypothetical protein